MRILVSLFIVAFIALFGFAVYSRFKPFVKNYSESQSDENESNVEKMQNEILNRKRLLKVISVVLCVIFSVTIIFLELPGYITVPLIVLLCVMVPLAFRLIEKNIGVFGVKKYKIEANKRAKEMKYENPVIKCDSCNSEFDTSLYKVCPHCGAAFDRDMQWQTRHAVDIDSEDFSADTFVEKQFEQPESKKEIKKSFKKLVWIAVIIAVIVALIELPAIILAFMGVDTQALYGQEDSRFETVQYDYTLPGDNVLLDCNVAKVTIKGFRKAKKNPENLVVDFNIINRAENKIKILVEYSGINGSRFSNTESFTLEAYSTESEVLFIGSYEIENTDISSVYDISFSVKSIEDTKEKEVIYKAEDNNQKTFTIEHQQLFSDLLHEVIL